MSPFHRIVARWATDCTDSTPSTSVHCDWHPKFWACNMPSFFSMARLKARIDDASGQPPVAAALRDGGRQAGRQRRPAISATECRSYVVILAS